MLHPQPSGQIPLMRRRKRKDHDSLLGRAVWPRTPPCRSPAFQGSQRGLPRAPRGALVPVVRVSRGRLRIVLPSSGEEPRSGGMRTGQTRRARIPPGPSGGVRLGGGELQQLQPAGGEAALSFVRAAQGLKTGWFYLTFPPVLGARVDISQPSYTEADSASGSSRTGSRL